MATTRRRGTGEELQPRLLKLAAASQYLSMSPSKLRSIVQRGEIAVIRGEGNAPWLLDKVELDRWIERSKQVLS